MPQHRTHPATPPPPRPLGAPPVFQGRRTCRALRAPGELRRPPRQNAWDHANASQRPHLGPPLRSPHTQWMGPPDLLGAKPTPRSFLEGPIPRGLAPQPRGLGTPEPQRRTHHAAPPPSRPLRAPPVIQGGRTDRTLRAPGDLRRPPAVKGLGTRSHSPVPSPRPAPPLAVQAADRACCPPVG